MAQENPQTDVSLAASAPPASTNERRHSLDGPAHPNRSASVRTSSTAGRISALHSRVYAAACRAIDDPVPVGVWIAQAKAASPAPSVKELYRAANPPDDAQAASGSDLEKGGIISEEPTASTSAAKTPELDEKSQTTVSSQPLQSAARQDDEIVAEQPELKPDRTQAAAATSSPTNDINDTCTNLPKPNAEGVYPNGYMFPRHKPIHRTVVLALQKFWAFAATPTGFFVCVYDCLIFAFLGMCILVAAMAAPAMCRLADGTYDCNNPMSARFMWLEIDGQMLNALFSITALGAAPWRFRDLYLILSYRIVGRYDALRKLAGYNRVWFRLPDSHRRPLPPVIEFEGKHIFEPPREDDQAYPLPVTRSPTPPLTGVRAPPTSIWKLDYCVWAMVVNTLAQVVLEYWMWGVRPPQRPVTITSPLIGVCVLSAMSAGLVTFIEGRRVNKIEGVPIDAEDGQALRHRGYAAHLEEVDMPDGTKSQIISPANDEEWAQLRAEQPISQPSA